jgi:hypothetical protein
LLGHARAIEFLDRQSGEAGALCVGATKLCRPSGGGWTLGVLAVPPLFLPQRHPTEEEERHRPNTLKIFLPNVRSATA